MDRIKASRFARWLEGSVTFLQTSIAVLLVVLLLLGVLNLAVTIGQSLMAQDVTQLSATMSLIRASIDIVLYLFVIVELYNTVVAYVTAESVVLAVIHAGLIGVVRQILTFKPDEYGTTKALSIGGVYVLLLLGLLVGFYIVHTRLEAEGEIAE